jgi:hypothetical protein
MSYTRFTVTCVLYSRSLAHCNYGPPAVMRRSACGSRVQGCNQSINQRRSIASYPSPVPSNKTSTTETLLFTCVYVCLDVTVRPEFDEVRWVIGSSLTWQHYLYSIHSSRFPVSRWFAAKKSPKNSSTVENCGVWWKMKKKKKNYGAIPIVSRRVSVSCGILQHHAGEFSWWKDMSWSNAVDTKTTYMDQLDHRKCFPRIGYHCSFWRQFLNDASRAV